MRITDLLVEAPQDELALQQLSRAVLAYIEECLATGKTREGRGGNIAVPEVRLGRVLPKGSWDHLYNVFAQTELVAIFAVSEHGKSPFPNHGEYYPGMNALTVYGTIGHDNQMHDKKAILSTIVHELRHRLDDSRSKGGAYRSKKERVPYLEQPSEIGARFTQAIADIIGPLKDSFDSGSVMSAHDFVKLFEQAATKYDLMSVFKYDPDSVTELFVDFAKNGIFGRAMPVDSLHSVVKSMKPSAEGQPVGPMDDKAYRRLISRVVLIYHAALKKWSK